MSAKKKATAKSKTTAPKATKVFDSSVLEAMLREREASMKHASEGPVETESALAGPKKVKLPSKKGWKHFSEVFGFAPPSGIDHAVRVFEAKDWDDEVRSFIPAIDDGYKWLHSETEMAVVGLMQKDRILLTGPKGSGKSTLTEQICARLNIPFMRVNCRQDMESSAIFGTPTVESGSIGWIPGPAEILARSGGVLQVDEISAAPAGINMAMQWMLERNGKVFVPDKPSSVGDRMIEPCDWFRVVATDNTVLQGDATGEYAGTFVQNTALLDRFSMALVLDYPDSDHEFSIIRGKVKGIKDAEIKKLLRVAVKVREAYVKGDVEFTMSPRTTLEWAEKIAYWNDPVLALSMVFFNKLTEDDRRLVNNIVHRVYARNVA